LGLTATQEPLDAIPGRQHLLGENIERELKLAGEPRHHHKGWRRYPVALECSNVIDRDAGPARQLRLRVL
jgi:hypothetical protein